MLGPVALRSLRTCSVVRVQDWICRNCNICLQERGFPEVPLPQKIVHDEAQSKGGTQGGGTTAEQQNRGVIKRKNLPDPGRFSEGYLRWVISWRLGPVETRVMGT